MEQMEFEMDCNLPLIEFGDISEHKLEDNYLICLFCSKHCYHSTDLFNSHIADLKRVFYSLQINLNDKLLKRENESALLNILCQNCGSVISKLSSLFKDLEVTKIWINHVLRNLMKIIISGEEDININTSTDDQEERDDYEKVVLRELIMEKCISIVKATSFPQLQLSRCQIPENAQEIHYYEDDEDDRLSTTTSSLAPSSPSLSSITKIVKLEEIDLAFPEEDDTLPTSPILICQDPNPQSSAASIRNCEEPVHKSVSRRKRKKAPTSKSLKSKSKPKPFSFIKPTIQTGFKRPRYYCPFCPKSFNGISATKFHSLSNHPEQIFPSCNLFNLNAHQFRACCLTILEADVTTVSNEDDAGNFTTFQCKLCPAIRSKLGSSSYKRVIQKHLIQDHYDVLVNKLTTLQGLQGTEEFHEKVADYLGEEIDCRKIGRSKKSTWKCKACGRGYPNAKQLGSHKKTCDGDGRGSSCGKHMTGDVNEASSKVPKASPCATCGKVFSCGYSLIRHKRLSCSGGLKQKVGESNVEILEEQMEEDILLPEVNDEDPLM